DPHLSATVQLAFELTTCARLSRCADVSGPYCPCRYSTPEPACPSCRCRRSLAGDDPWVWSTNGRTPHRIHCGDKVPDGRRDTHVRARPRTIQGSPPVGATVVSRGGSSH